MGSRQNDELMDLYGIADIYIQPSIYEPAGIVIHEALCSGTPVVASDVCGYGYEMLVHGVNGFLFKSEDHEDLTRYVLTILDNDELKEKMKIQAREIASKWNFDRKINSLNLILSKLSSSKKQIINESVS
jgi:glycosyltransferase involved in cell wall biosynthesis